MGLDTVELVMELEDEFELGIPDEDAERLTTIGETCDYLVGRLCGRPAPTGLPCPSAQAFYRLRRELTTRLGIVRRAIHPKSAIGDLVPAGQGRAAWRDVAVAAGLPEPRFNLLHPISGFPPARRTVRMLIGDTVKKSFIRSNGTVNEAAVFRTVRRITSEQMGVEEEEIHRDTHFINDLNMG